MRGRGTVSTLRLLAASAIGSLCASAQDAVPPVRSIDIYGSSVVDSAAARAEFGSDILRFVELGWQAGFNGSAPENASELEASMNTIESRTPLAHFDLGVTLDFGPPQQVDVTIDVVEKADEARRMPLRRADAELGDRRPPYLPPFERWRATTRTAVRRRRQQHRRVSASDGFVRPRSYERPAASRRPCSAARSTSRAAASERHARVAVLGARGANVDFPIRDLIVALDFPSSADRNKAAYTVSALADQTRYRDIIRADAVPAALRLLRLEKPNNHDPAYEILKQVSGEVFGDRDYAAWERWAAAR
jgi:hypothetical protein